MWQRESTYLLHLVQPYPSKQGRQTGLRRGQEWNCGKCSAERHRKWGWGRGRRGAASWTNTHARDRRPSGCYGDQPIAREITDKVGDARKCLMWQNSVITPIDPQSPNVVQTRPEQLYSGKVLSLTSFKMLKTFCSPLWLRFDASPVWILTDQWQKPSIILQSSKDPTLPQAAVDLPPTCGGCLWVLSGPSHYHSATLWAGPLGGPLISPKGTTTLLPGRSATCR